MRRLGIRGAVAASLLVICSAARAAVKVDVDHNDADHATVAFHFATVPPPSKADAATNARFTIVDGEKDDSGGDLDVLHDGLLPKEADEPASNFFFAAGSEGGRFSIDLGAVTDVSRVNTYSWHTDTRAPQVYDLYGSAGTAAGFNAKPASGTAPDRCGWQLIAKVDTRPKTGEPGGQYAVGISDPAGPLGRFRYLLVDARRTESDDDFGNTFYSEVDVITPGEMLHGPATGPATGPGVKMLKIDGGKYSATVDTTDTPELTTWADAELDPMIVAWYPKLIAMLPSPGYDAPTHFSVTFHEHKQGVADTLGNRINCAAGFFNHTLETEAKGAVLHEMVHVVQNYWLAAHTNRHPTRTPGWLTEGIPDYIRWYQYEPGSHGADIRPQAAARARYDAGYRPSANFLDWAVRKYDANLIRQLNAACREGTYTDDLWVKLTGKPLADLATEWKVDSAKPR